MNTTIEIVESWRKRKATGKPCWCGKPNDHVGWPDCADRATTALASGEIPPARPTDDEACPGPVKGRTTGGTVEPFDCQECGMLCEPGDVFHPYLYCWLRKKGVLDPGAFLKLHGFQPDPTVFPDA